MSYKVKWSLSKRLKGWLQGTIRRRIWGMEIHPTAVVEPTAYVDRTWPKGVHIGAECYLGEQAVMLTHDMVRGLYLDTHLGARSVLGARAIIMPGLRVGEDCVVAPGAVVIRDMPPGSTAAGNPAVITLRDSA